MILNFNTGKILANLPLGGGSDGAIFNPATMEAYSTHGNGTLTIVKENTHQFRGRADSANHEWRPDHCLL